MLILSDVEVKVTAKDELAVAVKVNAGSPIVLSAKGANVIVCESWFTVIVCVDAELVPQAFVAVTVMLPLPPFAVVLIEFVVDVPVQPPGNVQVYDVAPGTTEML